jgi:hypothetical protein
MDTYTPKYLRLWTLPDNYAGTIWPNYYSAGFGQSRDSDALERSNFETAWKALQKFEGVERVRESHWAVGWVEWIAIPADDFAALKVADEMKGRVKDYPVLDDEHFSQLEQDEADLVWKNCYNAGERVKYIRAHRSQFEFETLADMLECVRGNYFAGYASELL